MALSDSEASTGRQDEIAYLMEKHQKEKERDALREPYLPMDPESIYDRLSYQGKMKAKYAAEQRGVTLRTLFEKWPQYREG